MGPGCPVCVLPMGRIDDGLELASDPNVIFTAFGDMMRVPGSKGSPLESKARGADVRIVYSPLDALKIAQQNPDRKIVFFAIGFETTAPSTALTLLASPGARHEEFRRVFEPRDDHSGDSRDSGIARHAAGCIHRAGACFDGDRLPAV